MYSVELSQNAQKFLDKLDFNIKERIESTLKILENNPVPNNAKFIGRDLEKNFFVIELVIIGHYILLIIIRRLFL